MEYIDLHMHSTCSDGTFTPEELVKMAKKENLSAIAITDHDCIDGIKKAQAVGSTLGVEVIPGIEFSADFSGLEVHVLGLGFDNDHYSINNCIINLLEVRRKRNASQIKKLNKIGIDITMEEVLAVAGNEDVVTLAHFSQVLCDRGITKTFNEALDTYMRKGCPAHVEKKIISVSEAAAIVREAGGIPIIAHPYIYKVKYPDYKKIISSLKHQGIMGIECYYPTHTVEQTNALLSIAKELDMAVSAGSDFHGTTRPENPMGFASNKEKIPYSILTNILSVRDSKGGIN